MALFVPDRPLDENATAFPYTWSQYKKVFALAHISESTIISLQKEQIKTYSLNKNPILEQLNDELQGLMPEFSDEVEKKIVENIEGNLQGLRERFEKAKQNGIDFDIELNNLLNQYQDIIGQVMNITTLNYRELDNIGKSMYKLQTDINLLRNWLQSDSSGRTFEQMAKLRIADNKTANAHFITQKRKGAPSLLRQLAGIGTALKGLQLEQLATEKIAEKIPNINGLNNRTQVVNTGAIRVVLGGGGAVDIKEDIALFDMAFNDYEIELVNGQVITLKELLQRVNNSETVVLSLSGYSQLQQAMITAVSAKSTKEGKKIQLHAGLTTDKILSDVKDYDSAYWSLKHLRQIKIANSAFRGDKNYNALLINYNMSKMLTKIIGIKNDFLVTKNGFVSMKDYIENELNEGRYIAAAAASLDKPMAIQI